MDGLNAGGRCLKNDVRLPMPLDIGIEDVATIAALIGSIIIGAFYVLIRARASSKKS